MQNLKSKKTKTSKTNVLTKLSDSAIQNQWYKWGERGQKGQDRGMELRDSTMYKADKQKGYIIQHREMYLLFCKNFKWSIIYKKIE